MRGSSYDECDFSAGPSDLSSELDVGPLSWVKDEIDLALARAGECVADPARLKEARASLHQAGGALSVVGLAGVSDFSAAIEHLVVAATNGEIGWGESQIKITRDALSTLRTYLDGLIAGAPNQPLRLLPTYRALAEIRGVVPPQPVDLFFPDLTQRPPERGKPLEPLPQQAMTVRLRAARLGFERGLLKWFRDDGSGLRDMRNSVAIVEQLQESAGARAFWWSALAFFDVIAAVPVEDGQRDELRRVCRRIDTQVRKLLEGSTAVAERLMRDVLYWVAVLPGTGEQVQAVRAAYRLAGLIPTHGMDADAERLRVACLHRFVGEVVAAEQHWDRFCAGAAAALPDFHETSARLVDLAQPLHRVDLSRLAAAVANAANVLRKNPLIHGDMLAEEMTSALMLCEGGAEESFQPGAASDSRLAEQVDRVTSRLGRLLRGENLEGEEAPQLDVVARRAREKRILAKVGKQIQLRLATLEQTLDGFFRNPSDSSGLSELALPLKQVEGALALLDEGEALMLLRDCAARIGKLAAGGTPDVGGFEYLARRISALSAFIEALPLGGASLEQLLGESVAVAQAQATVEDELAGAVDATRTLVMNLREMSAAGESGDAVRTTIRLNLEALSQDAQLVADEPLQRRAATALAALEQDEEQLEHAVEALIPRAPETAASAATLALAGQPPEDVDAELLEIFLEEAREEMLALDHLLPALERDPADRISLGAVRRSFHTLKGSGHMVGLAAFGDAARTVEQVLNHRLTADAAADGALIGMLTEARELFGTWIAGLASRSPVPSAAALLEHCQNAMQQASMPTRQDPVVQKPVRLGALSLAPEIYSMFLEEARSQLATLERGDLAAAAAAATTLSSTAATVAFVPVAELAESLAKALSRYHDAAAAPDATTAPALAEAVATLRVMIETVASGRFPDRAEELLDALAALGPSAADSAASRGIDPQLLPLFLEEGAELTAALYAALRVWQTEPAATAPRGEVLRLLHTLKGSARMAGALGVGEMIHELEGRVAVLGEVTPASLGELEASFDRMAQLIDALGSPDSQHSRVPASEQGSAIAAAQDAGTASVSDAAETDSAGVLLRLRTDRVDQFISEAGEIAIARSRIEAEVRSIRSALSDLTENVARLRNQLREIEIQSESSIAARHVSLDEQGADFDPLEMDRYTRFQELTRFMAESVNDVSTVQHTLLRNIEHAQTALSHQGRLNRDLSQGLLRVRMVPFDAVAERLQRTARQVARETGREVKLLIGGGQTELDRAVLERLLGPLEHLLRNAIVHGIEEPSRRQAACKPEAGQIAINLMQRSGEVSIELRDDGAGLDLDQIRLRAVEGGHLKAGEEVDLQRLVSLIFVPGLTTARELSAVAGRGVGMDVVRREVMGLGGRIDVQTESGRGTAFTLILPASMAISQALLVGCGDRRYAIPSAMVEQALELSIEQLREAGASGVYRWTDRDYPLVKLSKLLGSADSAALATGSRWLLLMRGGTHPLALQVDALSGNQEIVMKPVGPQLARVAGIAGATVLGDGEIVLVLNPVALAAGTPLPIGPTAHETSPPTNPSPPLIMVVDDSLTVRKVTGRLLERAGYRVLVAKDGQDALEKLVGAEPVAMLADIEMPRMDGFEMVRRLRTDPHWKNLPVIMITSRTAEKHRGVALELGVEHFLGKPYDESALLHLLSRISGQRSAAN